jgi:hypothetical protein
MIPPDLGYCWMTVKTGSKDEKIQKNYRVYFSNPLTKFCNFGNLDDPVVGKDFPKLKSDDLAFFVEIVRHMGMFYKFIKVPPQAARKNAKNYLKT